MTEYRNPKLTVDAIVPMGEGVVLVKRGRAPFVGSWVLPGGFVDYGERPEEACLRELREEAGIEGRIARLVGVYGDPDRDPRGHHVSVVYEVERVRGEPRGGDDAAEAKPWPLHALPAMGFDHARILADWRAQRGKP
jgi:8-oxo-dGTP diphosphatase